MFDVVADGKAGRLNARLYGIWTMATVEAYAKALERSAQEAARSERSPTWLIDLTDLAVQPREIADGMAVVLEQMRGHWPASVAVVASQALVALQTKRIAQRPDHRLFTSVEEAEAWLDAVV